MFGQTDLRRRLRVLEQQVAELALKTSHNTRDISLLEGLGVSERARVDEACFDAEQAKKTADSLKSRVAALELKELPPSRFDDKIVDRLNAKVPVYTEIKGKFSDITPSAWGMRVGYVGNGATIRWTGTIIPRPKDARRYSQSQQELVWVMQDGIYCGQAEVRRGCFAARLVRLPAGE